MVKHSLLFQPLQEFLPQEIMPSPESSFIKTGQIPANLSPTKAKELGARILSKIWHETAMAKNGRAKLLLPTFRQRLYGGRLPKGDRGEIERQVNFAVNVFAANFPAEQKEEILRQIRKFIPGRMLSVNAILREKTMGSDLRQMRIAGKEFYHYLKEYGEAYPALTQETTRKTYFAKGWLNDRIARTAPIHEAVHILQKLGIIKVDIPFAQAVDRLYGLEQGLLNVDSRIRVPTPTEFDKKAGLDKKNGTLREPEWGYVIGDRIGQWAYLNLPKEKRWKYLCYRCMGKNHSETLLAL